jgi:fructokinase
MLLSCGDALIDFLPVKSTDGRDAIVPVAGGSCLNIAVGIARLGAPTAFVGGISTDLFGRMIADHAMASQVELRHATRSADQTTLAFVRAVDGEPQYAFYDEGTASRNWTYRQGSIAFDQIEAVHVGSTTLIHEKTAAETLAMVAEARGSAAVSFDPNCRPSLVADKTRYVDRMQAFVAAANIVRMSDVDFEYLYGGSDFAGKAQALIAAGVSLVVVTRGIRGAQAWHAAVGRGRRYHRRRRQFSGGAVVCLARHRTDQGPFAGASECRRASPRIVVCGVLRRLYLRACRCRSATAG